MARYPPASVNIFCVVVVVHVARLQALVVYTADAVLTMSGADCSMYGLDEEEVRRHTRRRPAETSPVERTSVRLIAAAAGLFRRFVAKRGTPTRALVARPVAAAADLARFVVQRGKSQHPLPPPAIRSSASPSRTCSA